MILALRPSPPSPTGKNAIAPTAKVTAIIATLAGFEKYFVNARQLMAMCANPPITKSQLSHSCIVFTRPISRWKNSKMPVMETITKVPIVICVAHFLRKELLSVIILVCLLSL
nr:hypothetical protein [Chloroherpeton thalassium]